MAGGISIYHALLPITEALTASTLTVTVDNDTFDLTSNGDGTYALGNLPNPSNPVGIYRKNGANYMALRDFDLGDHRVVIQEDTSSIETTECFKKAVQSVSSMTLNYFNEEIQGTTWSEAYDALENGAMLFLNYVGDFIPCTTYSELFIAFDQIRVDASAGVTSYRVQWNSDGTVTTNTVIYPQPTQPTS